MQLRITFIILLFFGSTAYGQYPYINHIDWMKPQINPAALGINRTENILLNYNRSWIANEVNSNLAILQYDRAIISGKNKNWGGIGVSLANEKVNYKEVLNRFQATVSAAYAAKIGDKLYLNFGMQGGYNADKVNNSGLLTGSQYVPGIGFDPGISNQEPGMNLNVDYFGISTGVFLYQASEGILPDNYVGLSIRNMNRPANSFYDNNSRLSPQINVMGGIKLLESMKSKLLVEALFSSSNQRGNLTVGTVYEMKYFGNSTVGAADASLRLLSRYSINNKILIGGQICYERFVVGFTYDIKTKATDRSYESGFEVLMGLNRKLKLGKQKKQTPTSQVTGKYLSDAPPQDTIKIAPDVIIETSTDSIAVEKEHTGSANVGQVMNNPPLQNMIYFEFASKEITVVSTEHLRELVVEFYRSGKNRIVVTGFTDDIGDDKYNRQLSLSRARSVKQKLVEFGLSQDHISIEGKGEEQALYPNDSEENRAKNRRVEITFY